MTDVDRDCEHAGYSHKKNRVYCRSFNHADARARYAAGETRAAIARDMGVSYAAVDRVVNPERRAQMDASSKKWLRENARFPCKGGCGRLVWMVGKSGRENKSGYCHRCVAMRRCKTARPGLLSCARCGEWKPDDGFPRQASAVSRRQRAQLCRSCQTIAKREYRERNKVPCSRCGKPSLAPNERRRNNRPGMPTGLCRDCWTETQLPVFHGKAVEAAARARRWGTT